jgi:hypothetical protein
VFPSSQVNGRILHKSRTFVTKLRCHWEFGVRYLEAPPIFCEYVKVEEFLIFPRFCWREQVVDPSIVLSDPLFKIMDQWKFECWKHELCSCNCYISLSTTTLNINHPRQSFRVIQMFCSLEGHLCCPVSLPSLLCTTYLLLAPCSVNIALVFCLSGYLRFGNP